LALDCPLVARDGSVGEDRDINSLNNVGNSTPVSGNAIPLLPKPTVDRKERAASCLKKPSKGNCIFFATEKTDFAPNRKRRRHAESPDHFEDELPLVPVEEKCPVLPVAGARLRATSQKLSPTPIHAKALCGS